MAPAVDLAECVDRLRRAFETYDSAVDVVSAFEMAFTTSKAEVPATVAHFERFPRIPDESGKTLTPDFSVVFDDGTGLIGEIARIALREESIDSLCEQIAGYDALRQLPTPQGLVEVSRIDVLVLVPQSVGVAAVKRIINERFANEKHSYKPSVAPCVVQSGYTEGRYIFQRLLEPLNGLPDDGDRPDGLGHWFAENGDFKAKPQRFSEIKAERAFINDPVDRLYLATHLWAKTFPTMAGDASRPVRLDVTPADLAAELRAKFGGVRSRDVRRALKLLQTAQLASPTADGWVVAWEELRVPGEKELAHAIATRACRPPARTAATRLKQAEEAAGVKPKPPETLF